MIRVERVKMLLYSTEEQVKKYAEKTLSSADYAVFTNKTRDYIFARPRGDITPEVILVAHMDTVHTKPPTNIFHDQKQNVLWSPDGLGADDRAGVFAVLELAKKFPVAVLLTTGEESGGKGVGKFIADYPSNIFGIKMAIELDRRDFNDCVFYSCDNEEFHDYIVGFGFIKRWGSFSDISVLGPAWRINSTNLSIGFINEHMVSEHLMVDVILDTMNKVSTILSNPIPQFEYKEYYYKGWSGKTKHYDDKWGRLYYPRTVKEGKVSYKKYTTLGYTDEYDDFSMFGADSGSYQASFTDDELFAMGCVDCMSCGDFIPENKLVFTNNGMYEVCPECYKEDGFICQYCGGMFLKSMADNLSAAEMGVCDDCFDEFFLKDCANSDKVIQLPKPKDSNK